MPEVFNKQHLLFKNVLKLWCFVYNAIEVRDVHMTLVLYLQESWSALLCASKEGHLEIVIELLERNADIEHKDMVRVPCLYFKHKP